MKLTQRLLDPADEYGDNGGGSVIDNGPENLDDGYQQDNQTTDDQTPAPANNGVQINDPDAFAAALARSLAAVLPPQQQQIQQQRQPTDEEFRQQTKYYAVTEQDVKELYGEPPDGVDAAKWLSARASVMQRQLDGMATHSMLVSKHLMDYRLEEALRPYKALLDSHQKTTQQQYIAQIAEKSPALKEKPFLVESAVEALRKANYQSRGEAEDLKIILATAEQLGKRFDPNFSLTTQNGASIQSRSRGNMPGAVNGAGGGAGAGGRQNNNPIAALYS